jgi:beta-N-acetylhexosaminidase
MPSAAIYDCEGAFPTADERAFFRDADPFGFILFARHCADAEAVKSLCTELRSIVGRDAPILIDQEGGRVARMKPPVFPAHPAPASFGALWNCYPAAAKEAARLNAFLIARMVSDLGVDVVCAPMLDVPAANADATVIGDRAIARHPDVIAALGREIMDGLLDGGALPVVKHMPGHGRATVDSHYDLPRVSASREELQAIDFAPFIALNDAPLGMTAHVVYEALDGEKPATMSSRLIADVIRREMGFDGLLFSDDLKMQALGGQLALRARDCLHAGCDIALCCNYPLADRIETAKTVPVLAGKAAERAEKALKLRRRGRPADLASDYRRLVGLLQPALA